jgi:methylenetetrahydrofolate dehydrogenase (NADP+)/methenyltetrahydrofolate cyclohydrolase
MSTCAPGKLIDGKATANAILAEVAEKVAVFGKGHRPPRLAVMIVGEDPASKVYVRGKIRSAKKCGIDSTLMELPEDVSGEEFFAKLDSIGADADIDGVLVQLPLPGHIDQRSVIERIPPHKDVDGFHPYNLGRLASGDPLFVPCTPLGIVELLSRYGVSTTGRHVVIVGRSIIVGKPLALLLSRKGEGGDATVTICHSRTRDIAAVASTADILVAAVGSPAMIKAGMVKNGVVVIDVGVNRVDDPGSEKGYRLSGDVDFDTVHEKASLITPVPGGVGPMTRAMLMCNTLQAAIRARGLEDEGV